MPETVEVTTPPPAASGGGAHAADDSRWIPPEEAPPPPGPALAGAEPAADPSPMVSLRAQRAKIQSRLYIDIRVPRYGDGDGGPRIYVRYNPLNPSDHSDRIQKAQKAKNKPKDWMTRENAQMLVSACVGVWAWQGDDDPIELLEQAGDDPEALAQVRGRQLSLREGDPHGGWTRFDPDLADALGLPENCGAQRVVRALYFTEGDLTASMNRLMAFSGVALASGNEDFTGS
jgi:hypothetical protein